MAGNTVQINKYKPLTWYVGDNKIDKVIKFLNKNGKKIIEREHEKDSIPQIKEVR